MKIRATARARGVQACTGKINPITSNTPTLLYTTHAKEDGYCLYAIEYALTPAVAFYDSSQSTISSSPPPTQGWPQSFDDVSFVVLYTARSVQGRCTCQVT